MWYIYTDGACDVNDRTKTNTGAYGYITINDSGVKIAEFVHTEHNTTNNRMELKAVLQVLEDYANHKEEITIMSDSTYVVNAINKKWINKWQKRKFQKQGKDIPNKDLWEKYLTLVKPNISFKWVKGHSTNIHNQYVDKLVFGETVKNKIRIINR